MDNVWQFRCPDSGEWMAFFDGEGRPTDREQLGAHLRQCAACQEVFEDVGEMVAFGDTALDLVHPIPVRSRGLASRRTWIPAAAAAAVILGAGLAFHNTGQRAVAAIGSLFQVKSIGTVAIGPNQLARLSRIVTQGGQVTLAHYGSVKVAGPMTEAVVPLSHLSQYGMPNLWPAGLGQARTASVQTGLSVSLTLNVPNINALITSQGGTSLFPMSVNHVPFTLSIPAAATIQQGAWTVEEAPRPTLAVPGQVPTTEIAKAMENLPFLPSQLQSAVAQMANWKNALVVPLPGHPHNVSVAGTTGIVDANPSGTTAGEAWIANSGLVVAVLEHQSSPINVPAFESEVARLFP